MSAPASKHSSVTVRAWARANGIPVSKKGKIALHVQECYAEAHPEYAVERESELQARNNRPDLFALADDMVEAELVRTGRLTLEAPVANATSDPAPEEPRSLSEWLRFRDELAATIGEYSDPREAAEALLVRGWMTSTAA